MMPVIFILGVSALPLAKNLAEQLDAKIHGPKLIEGIDAGFDNAISHLRQLFIKRVPIIGLCASGILIRAVAPMLGDKKTEPPVVAVAEDGTSVVPLLGGHKGANRLAKQISEITKGHAAITTASELRLGVAYDDLDRQFELANPEDMKSITAAKLAGLGLQADGSWRILPPMNSDDVIETIYRQFSSTGKFVVHPKQLAIGVGCERGVESRELRDLVENMLVEHNLSEKSVAGVWSIDVKLDESAISDLADHFNVSPRFFSAAELQTQEGRLKNPSEQVRQEVGTAGVAEAAALLAAGRNSELLVEKTKSKRCTVAIALASDPIYEFVGKARGIVSVVGIGPGNADMRSWGVTRTLQEATDWVGYDLYLDLIQNEKSGEVREHRFPLGDEETRCRHAIELAKAGKRVALVCSGDAAIYAMAALVYELIDREPNRIKVEVHPGISAFQAASAKAGAMIGHDFCCISLSDLLTPWEAIEKRIKAAAEGDFVISFYNPRSLKRRDQLERAFAILKNHRPPDTPVVVATNLGRPEENVRIGKFSEFDPEEVDMLTLVMVGSSQSKSITRGDGKTYAYTPRGYATKMDAK